MLSQLLPGCGHDVQTTSPPIRVSEYRPASQRQSATLVDDMFCVQDRAGHGLHAPMLDRFVTLDHVPVAHGIATPALHHLPGGHSEHAAALPKPEVLPTVPGSHGVGAELPAAHQDDLMQSLQDVCPALFW